MKVSGGPNLGTFLLKLYLAGLEVQRDTATLAGEPDVTRRRRANGLGASLAISGVLVLALICASFPTASIDSTVSDGGANGGGGPIKPHYDESVPRYSVRKDKEGYQRGQAVAIFTATTTATSEKDLRTIVKDLRAKNSEHDGLAVFFRPKDGELFAAGFAFNDAEAEAFVRERLGELGRIRLSLLQDIWHDAGGDPWTIPQAVEELGGRVEELPEFDNRRFVFPPAEGAA